MKKRILIHAPHLKTPGGKQTYYAALQSHFESAVTFFFYGANGQKESRVRTLWRMLSDYRRFLNLLRKGDFDVVHLNPSLNLKSFFRDSIFALICSFFSVKILVFWHGWNWDFERKYVQKIKPYFRWTYGKAHSMIVLAKEFEQQLKNYGYQKSIFLETTVVDNSIFNFGNSNKKEKKAMNLLFLARLEKEKGIYETINSFANVQKKIPRSKLEVAGTGSELEKVKQYVFDHQIPNISFLGWITGKEKIAAFSRANIYILASHGEGMPISLLEAMATGSAILTTNVGGIKDFFQHEKMGLLIETKNQLDLEERLVELLSNSSMVQKMSKYNQSYAQQHFTPQKVSQRIETIYTKLFDKNKNVLTFSKSFSQ